MAARKDGQGAVSSVGRTHGGNQSGCMVRGSSPRSPPIINNFKKLSYDKEIRKEQEEAA